MRRIPLVFAALVAAISLSASGEETVPSEPKNLRELIDASTKWFEVFPDGESKEPAQTLTVLRWANNARGSEDGITMLFIHGGRPIAAACIYPWEKRLEHDFESLNRGKVVAKRDGAIVWQPQEAGVTFADIPRASAPEATRTGRLRQMKTLAERFKGTLLGWKKDNTDREELRLLSRPLFRYEPKDGDIIDGVVFAFVMGTDPEILLLIEAVKDKDAAKWQYAFARRTSGELEGRLDDAVVWTATRFPAQNNPRLPHFTKGTPLPPTFLPATLQEDKRK